MGCLEVISAKLITLPPAATILPAAASDMPNADIVMPWPMLPVPRTLPGTATTSPSFVRPAILPRLTVLRALVGFRASFDRRLQIGALPPPEALYRSRDRRTVSGLVIYGRAHAPKYNILPKRAGAGLAQGARPGAAAAAAAAPAGRPRGGGGGACPEAAPAGRFTLPMSVAALPGGRICVADRRACRVRVYGPAGRLELSLGSRGALPGQFAHPAGVAALPGGRICVADCENHRVQVLAPRGAGLAPEAAFGSRTPSDLRSPAPPGTFLFPLGVAALPGGRICVADTKNHRVQVLGPRGAFELELGSRGPARPCSLRSPMAVAAGPRGRVYAAGGLCRTGPGAAGACADAVHVFGPAGDLEFAFGPHGAGRGMVDSPSGLAVDARGGIVVADTGNDRVVAFDDSGRFSHEIAGPERSARVRGPTGVAVRADGSVCVAEAYDSGVLVVDPCGTELLRFGAGGTGGMPPPAAASAT